MKSREDHQYHSYHPRQPLQRGVICVGLDVRKAKGRKSGGSGLAPFRSPQSPEHGARRRVPHFFHLDEGFTWILQVKFAVHGTQPTAPKSAKIPTLKIPTHTKVLRDGKRGELHEGPLSGSLWPRSETKEGTATLTAGWVSPPTPP